LRRKKLPFEIVAAVNGECAESDHG
jgi:hypothetical protein